MATFIKFSSIDQYRHIIRTVKTTHDYKGRDADDAPIYSHTSPYPTMTFTGTVKLHGTNAAVCYRKCDNTVWYQSRNRILTVANDNAGFAQFAHGALDTFKNIFDTTYAILRLPSDRIVSVYGEWCGQGIQKGVGISKLPKLFVIFDIRISQTQGEDISRTWLNEDLIRGIANSPDCRVFNIYTFPNWNIEIDFNTPKAVQARLSELTLQVENECPVAKALGVSGIGEGIVWTSHVPNNTRECEWGSIEKLRFKVKGEKHSVTKGKTRTLAPIDVEKANSVAEFVARTVTENRMKQGIEYVFTQNSEEVSIRKLGAFIRWVLDDLVKEESDTMNASGITNKDIGKPVANKARKWFSNL